MSYSRCALVRGLVPGGVDHPALELGDRPVLLDGLLHLGVDLGVRLQECGGEPEVLFGQGLLGHCSSCCSRGGVVDDSDVLVARAVAAGQPGPAGAERAGRCASRDGRAPSRRIVPGGLPPRRCRYRRGAPGARILPAEGRAGGVRDLHRRIDGRLDGTAGALEPLHGIRAEEVERVGRVPIRAAPGRRGPVPHLEMQVRPGAVAGVAGCPDDRSGLHLRAQHVVPAGQVGVQGGGPVRVLDADVVPVGLVVLERDHPALHHRPDRRPHPDREVDPGVVPRRVAGVGLPYAWLTFTGPSTGDEKPVRHVSRPAGSDWVACGLPMMSESAW